MSGVYFFDTETTSLEADREIVEAALVRAIEAPPDLAGPNDRIPGFLIGFEARFCQRYRPSRPSTLGSIAVHHILPGELIDCPPSSTFKLPEDAEYIIGHNVDFDWEAAGKPNVKRIDTNCIARYVYPNLDSYSQSALLYHVLGATPTTRDLLKNAHSALQDVENNVRLLDAILRDAPKTIATWSELYAYSEECRIPRVMPIGDRQGVKGLTLRAAYETDPGFVDWCLRQDWLDPYLREGLERAIEAAEEAGMTANVYANEASALAERGAAAQSNDDRANELIERYLARSCQPKRDGYDYQREIAHKLGTAIAMLGSLLELYDNADPEITRRIFDRWRAEQSAAAGRNEP